MQQTELICVRNVQRMQQFLSVVLVKPIVIWTANREYVVDTGSYILMYSEMPNNMNEILGYMAGIEKDKGFYLISVLIKLFVTDNARIYFFIVAAFQAYFLFRIYRKYSTRYVISFFLFIASTDYVSWMFNGMRQFVAVTITLVAFEFILEKEYVKSVVIVLIASLFHQSALLVLPFIFISQGKAWNKKTLLFIVVTVIAIAYIEPVTNILDTMLRETQYENVVSDWKSWEDDGTNVIRVLVYAVPTFLSLFGLRFIRAEDNRIINICTNMSIVSTGFYMISMFTSGIFIGRLPIYFSLYGYILLPWEIEHMFEEKSQRLIYLFMIVAYLMFYYYQVVLSWGLA